MNHIRHNPDWQPAPPPSPNFLLTTPSRSLGCVIDHTGDLWTWNCGWTRNKGHSHNLGHAAFRGAVKLFNRTQPDAKTVLMGIDKPMRSWRRVFDHTVMQHDLIGRVRLMATDGCHAVVLPAGAFVTRRVCYENLTEVKEAPKEKMGRTTPAKTRKAAKVKRDEGMVKLASKYLDLCG